MDRATVFTQKRNDEKDIEAIADGYKTKIGEGLWLTHGLQKDAIQNSWDARIDKKHGRGWECGLRIIGINGKKIICISDTGTTGLNGTKFSTEAELSEILNRNETGEDLAYFLSSNWSAKRSEEGGNRGRGKTLFLASSQDKKIFFDSLRSSDGSYVFGEVYLDSDKQVKFILYYDQEGKSKLLENTENLLTSLKSFGTRIFITNPNPDIQKAINSGEIIALISNSRWEVIKKYNAKIFIATNGEKKYVPLPKWYEDSPNVTEGKEFPAETIKEGTQYKIKRLVLRYAPNDELPQTIKGIAIQRGGMTIQRLLADDLVHEDGMSDIYGWVEMEKILEEDIKEYCEGPEHFDFAWNTNPAKYLRVYLSAKIREFAKEFKIISSEQSKRNKIQKLAEEKALKSLTPLFKNLGLFGHHKGSKNKIKSKRKKDEPLRLSIADIEFPRDARRINYDESIRNAYVIPINDFTQDILVRIHVYIVSGDGKNTIEIAEKEYSLSPGVGEKIGKELLTIDTSYKKDTYSFRAKMISLEDTNLSLPDDTRIEKGTILYDRVNLKFYVETDPPEHGPFNFQPKPKEDKMYILDWESDLNGGYIIYYNTSHPRIKILLQDTDEKKLTQFLIEQGALLAFQIKLEDLMASSDNDSDKDLLRLIKSKDPSNVWPIFLQKYSEFLWNLNI